MASINQIEFIIEFLKHRIKFDRTSFMGHSSELNQISELVARTAENGESNSALVIGPVGSGKTTLIKTALAMLSTKPSFKANTLIVNLNGFIHTDDSLALKSIAKQMQLETAIDGKVFTTFADNLAFLLDCLKVGDRSHSKCIIFILEEFDLFCAHSNQTLIYNLFDVAQSAQAPICVIGVTRRYDVIELLEKRVKSRFSHRQIFLFNEINGVEDLMCRLVRQLHIQTNDPKLKKDNLIKWNKEIAGLTTNKQAKEAIEALTNQSTSMALLNNLTFRILTLIPIELGTKTQFTTNKLALIVQRVVVDEFLQIDSKVQLMCDLSILEILLIISMKHYTDIYDGESFNFEMILTRLRKFQNSGEYSMGNYDREVLLKAFDVLKHLGLISSVGNANKEQKEFQLHKLLVQDYQIHKMINCYKNLPTQIAQWAKTSQV